MFASDRFVAVRHPGRANRVGSSPLTRVQRAMWENAKGMPEAEASCIQSTASDAGSSAALIGLLEVEKTLGIVAALGATDIAAAPAPAGLMFVTMKTLSL